MLNSSQHYLGSLTCQSNEQAIFLFRLVFMFPFRLNTLALRQKKKKKCSNKAHLVEMESDITMYTLVSIEEEMIILYCYQTHTWSIT